MSITKTAYVKKIFGRPIRAKRRFCTMGDRLCYNFRELIKKERDKMNAVITVIGADKVGILASISTVCANSSVNIEEVTQTILRGMFAMIMLVTLPEDLTIESLSQKLGEAGKKLELNVTVTRQEIYDVTHKV
jgi:ACT domain-containing protein